MHSLKQFRALSTIEIFYSLQQKIVPKLNLIRSWFLLKRCNDLEVWLQERGYSHMMARHEVLKANKLKISEAI